MIPGDVGDFALDYPLGSQQTQTPPSVRHRQVCILSHLRSRRSVEARTQRGQDAVMRRAQPSCVCDRLFHTNIAVVTMPVKIQL